ncbi:MAG: hypothetical protein EXS12_00650 [Phycisphaerales bacterium]|nr:hypothetical protein [Phycisphaerales bacterium]
MNKFETLLKRVVFLAALLCAACSTPQPIVQSNEVFPGDLASVNRELTSAESQRVLKAMASTRTQKNIDDTRPLQTSTVGRWSDVYMAAVIGSRKVEMAVVEQFVQPDGLRFTILTLNNDQGELVVKGDAAQGVLSASATLGLFGERTKDAKALVSSFYSQLHVLCAIPRPTQAAPIAAVSTQ